MTNRDKKKIFSAQGGRRKKQILNVNIPYKSIACIAILGAGYLAYKNDLDEKIKDEFSKQTQNLNVSVANAEQKPAKLPYSAPIYPQFELDIEENTKGLEKVLIIKGGEKLGEIMQKLPTGEEIRFSNVYDFCLELILSDRSYGPEKNVKEFLDYAVKLGLPLKNYCEDKDAISCFLDTNYKQRL